MRDEFKMMSHFAQSTPACRPFICSGQAPIVLPCSMFALEGKLAGFPSGPIAEPKTPGGIGDCDDDRPGNGANGGRPGDLWPSPKKLLFDEERVVGLPSFLFIALVARSRELRNIDDWILEFSENILAAEVTERDGTPVIASVADVPWLE